MLDLFLIDNSLPDLLSMIIPMFIGYIGPMDQGLPVDEEGNPISESGFQDYSNTSPYNTLFSSYVSGGGYSGYGGFNPNEFTVSNEDIETEWQDFLDNPIWDEEDISGYGSEYIDSDQYQDEQDAYTQLGDLYQGFQADMYGSRKKLTESTRSFDKTSGKMGLISGKRMTARKDILQDSTEAQQSLFSNYLSERTGLAGTIDQAREDYFDFLDEQSDFD